MTADTAPIAVPRVLLAEESLPFRRVIREALTAFRVCEVDDAPSGERAFEMALRREYALFLFSLPLPDMSGDMLDRLLSTAYPLVHASAHAAPPEELAIIHLLDAHVGQWEFPTLRSKVLALASEYRPNQIWGKNREAEESLQLVAANVEKQRKAQAQRKLNAD